MDPRLTPQVAIEAVLFLFEPGAILLLPLPLAALVLLSVDGIICAKGKWNETS